MNGKQLYTQLKLGQINKNQLTDNEKGELYKFMVESNKISAKEVKPEVAKKYNLVEPPKNVIPETQTYTPSRSPDTNAPIAPINRGKIVPDIGTKSTNPELELVDVLSNLTFPQRGRTIVNEKSQAQPYVRQPMNDDITLIDRIKSGVSSIGKTTLGSGMSALGTNVERFSNPWELTPDYQKDIQKFTTESTGIKPVIDLNKELEQSRQKRSEQLKKAQELGIPNTLDLMQQSDKLLQSAAEDNQRGKQGLGKGGQIAYDILQGAGQMGADIGIGMATGTGLLPVIGVRSMGSGASEARQAGADINDQVAYGTLSAGIELATEKIVGGLPFAEKLGASGIADNTIKKLASGIARSPRLTKALTYIGNMAGEGAEEMIAEILSPVAQRLTYDPNADWATIEEVLYSGLMGAGVSGIMGGGVFLQGNPIVKTLDTELNTIYQAIDNGTLATEQDLNKTVEFLQGLEQQYPDLQEYLQGHIEKVDRYKEQLSKPLERPTTSKIDTIDTLLDGNTNVVQNSSNDLTDDISTNMLQESNQDITETQQNEFIDDNNNEKIEVAESNTQPLEINTETTNIINDTNGNNIVEGDSMKDKNVGYHAGDLGKADYLNIMPSRGTGHFGTGTYFVGNEKDIDLGDYKERPRHTVSFEGYNLYKPKTTEEGRNLHKFLKNINDMSLLSGYEDVIDDIINSKVDDEYIDNLISTKFPYNSEFDFNIDYSDIDDTNDIETMLKQIDKKVSETNIPPEVIERKRNIEQYQSFLNKLINNIESVKNELKDKFNFSDDKINGTIKELYNYGTSNLNSAKMDSPSTVFMKSLGYEGVDVRGLKGLDDTEFGSVIYDLKGNQETTLQAITEPTTNETIPNEQIVDEDTNIAQTEDKGFTDNKELNDKIKRTVESEAFEKAMKVFGYKTLEEKSQYDNDKPKKIRIIKDMLQPEMYMNQRLQFEALTKKFEKELQNDKKIIQSVIDEYNKGEERRKRATELEDSYNKEDWQVPRDIYLERGNVAENVATKKHRQIIEQALNEGKNVPDEVLKDYPDLIKKTEEPKQEVETDVAENATTEPEVKTVKAEDTQIEITIDNFMDSISENDIDYKKAVNAHNAISFDPEKRAKLIQKEYVRIVKGVYENMLPLAKTEEQKAILLSEMQKFKEKYIQMENAVLSATSRTMSAMITGPAKFPTARNQKALDVEHKRMTEFSEWLSDAQKTIEKKLNNALPESEKANEVLNKLKKEVDDTIASLLAIKKGASYSPALFRSSLKGYFERNLNNGNIEEVKQAAEYLKEQEKKQGITVFTSVNNIWKQIENAKPKEVETGESTFKEYDGARIVENKNIDRIQLFFDEKPNEEIRNEMKKSGWHYSKANGDAWQRKITRDALRSAEKILDKFFKKQEVTQKTQAEETIQEQTGTQTYRYYLTQRPPSPGTFPKGTTEVMSFDDKQEVDGLEAWGYVEYDKPLTETQKLEYELVEKTEYEFDKALKEAAKKEGKQTETVTETKEEQIEETKEELKERVENKQEVKLNQNETKIFNVLNSNLDDMLSSTYDGEYFVDSDKFDEYFEIPKNKKDGFDEYQRISFVKDLIAGLKSNKNSIHVEIPDDGTFDINNSQDAVSIIINRLGVKVKSPITPNIERFIKSATTFQIGKDYYSDGIIAIRTDNYTLSSIKESFENKAKIADNTIDTIIGNAGKSDEWIRITEFPVITIAAIPNTNIKKDTYIFSINDDVYGYSSKHLDMLNKNGNEIYIYKGSDTPILKAVNNGEMVGFMMPLRMNDFKRESPDLKNGNLFGTVKQNFWSKPKQSKNKASKGEQAFTGNTPPNKTLIDKSRTLKKPTEIRKFITKAFNVPTSSKKFNRSKKFLGYYKVMPEVIRLRYDNEIGTVMHELGHHLDKKYDFSNIDKKLIDSMVNKMNPAFKKNYQKSELPGEAIAEFLRYYTTDPMTAEQFAGDFYDLFEQTLSKEDLKNIQIVRSDVLRWVNAERSEKRQSTIVPLSQKKKLGERISEVINFEKYNMILFDKYAPLQRFVNTVEKLTGRKIVESLNPHVLVERTYKNDAAIEGIIRGQLRDTKGNDIQTEDNLQKLVNEVGEDMAAFEDYLKLKHAITLENNGHQIYSRDIYNSVQEMEQDLATIEQEYPKFVEQSERLYDWYDKFFKAWVVDTNMLGKDSKKAYQTMREEYPYYVPMFRVREDNSTKRAKSSLTDQKSPIDRLSEKGNDQDTISPIDNIITQVSRMVNAYSKNNVMRAIVKNYNTVDGLGGFIDRVPPDMEKQIISTQSIKDMIDYDFKTNDNAELIDNIINAIPDLVENYKTLTVSKDQEIVGVIAEDGSRQFYQVFDKAFLDSLTNMNPTQLDATVRLIASVRRTTTALTTGLNPIFSIASNAPRDFTQAYIFGSYKNPVEYVYQYAKALINVATKTGNYKKFKELGGVYGSSMTSELRNKNDFIRHLDKYRKGKKIIPKNALHYIGEFILDINDAIETAPRLAEFNKAYKLSKNKSEQDRLLYALSKADDVTLNFSRKGTIMNTWVGQSIPYLNAGLQGMDKLRRGMFTGEEKAQTFIKALTMLTIPTILLWLAHRDDEDYERLSKGIKDNYWVLWKRDDGSFFRIPKPKDLSAIFSSDFERALNAYFKEEGAGAFEGFQSTLADSLLPPTNTIFGPLIDVAKNEKWSGSKIVGMSMSFLPKTEQYDDTTSRIGVIIAQAIGKVLPGSDFASPKNVDYLLDQYYGGLADILLPLTTPNSYTTAEFIKRKFSADPSYSNDVVNDFYELRDKTMKANKAYDDREVLSDDVDLIAGQQFKAYYKIISAKWKDVDYIGSLENKSLTKEEKQAYTELINQSRYVENTKQKVREDLKDGKLSKETITILQKTIRDDIVKTAEKAVKEYKATHKMNNEKVKQE